MKLSIITTLYQSSPYIEDFYCRASKIAENLVGDQYEIIFVNDGSPDDSLKLALEILNKDQHIKVIDLSRNFGHHRAMMTGLQNAAGELAFLIDSDLEEEPEWLYEFYRVLHETNSDVAYGVQAKRKGDWFEKISGDLFYRFCRFAGINIPKNVITARLMTRKFLTELLKFKETEMYLGSLFAETGFRQTPVVLSKISASPTTYTLKRKLVLLIDVVTSSSSAPLVWIFYIGLAIEIASLSVVFIIFIKWFIFSRPISGWTSIIASIWLIGGMIISFIGVIGIYLSKIYREVKQRPLTVIKDIYEKK